MTHIERLDTTAEQAWLLTDDEDLNARLTRMVSDYGFEVVVVNTEDDIRGFAGTVPPGLAFVDLDAAMPDAELARCSERMSESAVVVLLVSESSLLRLLRTSPGAFHLTKPIEVDALEAVLCQVRRFNPSVERQEALFGSSPQIQVIRKLISQIAVSGNHVTVTGETGVGKRLVGRLIHKSGPRASGPLVQIGCAGFSESVVAGLLFGSPDSGRKGYLERCRRGTLMIDDIDVLHLPVQERLWAWLGEGEGRRSIRPRVIAVSSRKLSEQVRAGAFHPGLFEILGHAQIEIPPLRERKADIPILADWFSRSVAEASNRPSRGIEPPALAELMRYDWPGNVRELRDIVELATRSSTSDAVTLDDLPSLPDSTVSAGPGPSIPGSTIHEIEKEAILRTLEATGGSTTRAARMLEMSVRKIQYKLKEYRSEASSLAAMESRPSLGSGKSAGPKKSSVVAGRGRGHSS